MWNAHPGDPWLGGPPGAPRAGPPQPRCATPLLLLQHRRMPTLTDLVFKVTYFGLLRGATGPRWTGPRMVAMDVDQPMLSMFMPCLCWSTRPQITGTQVFVSGFINDVAIQLASDLALKTVMLDQGRSCLTIEFPNQLQYPSSRIEPTIVAKLNVETK